VIEMRAAKPFNVITGTSEDPYRPRIEEVYAGDPEIWKQVLGESLFFHLGVYEGADRSMQEAATAYLDAQLEIAGFAPGEPGPRRVLDIGCGWGSVLAYLAGRFPGCARFDGINVSSSQLEYAARRMDQTGTADRVALYLCDARDIDLLPDPACGYDLVIARGSVAHFTGDVLERTAAALGRRTRSGGAVVIAEVLYNDLDTYRSAIEDSVDRLACGHRKSPGQVTDVLQRNGFRVKDARVLPTSEDAIRWFTRLKDNIDEKFPGGALLPALGELHDVAANLESPLARGDVAAYSIVAIRD
jgi:cyclopropane fatty-acyl-phospholipid synthase-like methyltransferase